MSEIQNETLYQVVVFNKTNKDGYRRAGLALLKGENTLQNVTSAQIEKLKTDPRLVIQSQTEMAQENRDSKRVSEEHTDNPPPQRVEDQVLPANLTVEQLKTALTKKGIEFHKSAKKDELVALLEQAYQGDE